MPSNLFDRTLQRLGMRWVPGVSSPLSAPKRDYEDIKKVNAAMLPLLAFGLIAAIWVGWNTAAIGAVLLWCMTCLAVGATVGFLFGIPRASKDAPREGAAREPGKQPIVTASERQADAGRPNTNLEEVSDWLTKIIVGLALVNLSTIEGRVLKISRHVAAALRDKPTEADVSAATAIVVGFVVVGFLCGYLYTRLFLQGAFIRSDGELRRFREVLSEELSKTTPETPPPSGEPSAPTLSDRQAAERVLQVTPSSRPEEVLVPLRALAMEYEKLRRDLPFGPERTRKMSEVANGMKRLALAAAPFLTQLMQSDSPGERLAAVVILQMKFDSSHIEWLANRLVEEPAFVGHQAASTLLSRKRVVGAPEQERIKAAVQVAVKRGIRPEPERDRLVEEILKA